MAKQKSYHPNPFLNAMMNRVLAAKKVPTFEDISRHLDAHVNELRGRADARIANINADEYKKALKGGVK